MASGGNIEIARCYVSIIPSMEGSQAEITKELTGVTNEASEKAGDEGGSKFGSKFAAALKGSAVAIGAAMTAATGAAIATGKAFINAANDTAAYGDEVDKMSQKLGLSAQAYQEWDYVMQLAGTDMSSMGVGFKSLANHIADATSGGEDAQKMFASLGISLDDLKTMSTEDIFGATVKGLQNMEEGADRSALSVDLFGKSGQNMAALFNMTNEEVEDAIALTHEYGMVMDDEGVKNAAAYTDAMTTLKGTMTGLKNSLMSQFMPGLTQVIEGLSMVFSGQGGIGMIQEGLQSVIGNIVMIAPQFITLASTILSTLISSFAPLLPSLVRATFMFLNQALTAVVNMIPQLVPVIIEGVEGVMSALFEAMPLIIDGLLTVITDLVTWLASDENVTTFINGIIELVSLLINQFALILPVLLPAIVKIISEVATALTAPENVNMLLQSVLLIIGSICIAIAKSIPEIIKLVVNTTKNILATLKSWGSSLISNLGPWFQKVLLKIQTFATDIYNKIKGLPDKFLSIGKDIITGMWNGIQNKTQWLKDKVASLGTTVTNAVKKALGIKSPSRVFMGLGAYTAEGFGIGFEESMQDVESDMKDSINGLTGSMSANITANGTGASMLNGSTYNGGAININVYGAEGQNVDDLAKQIAYRLEEMTRRKEAVYG